MKKMGEEMAKLRLREANVRDHLQNENKALKAQLPKKEEQLATMASLAMEAIHYMNP